MFECIIFDLDGTLVDSEPLCNQAFLDLLPEISLSVDDLLMRFRGRKLSEILKDIEDLIGRKLSENFETTYRTQVKANFEASLEAFPDLHDTLRSIEIPFCIASSGPQKKIISALKKTCLDTLFYGRTFSSYDIGKWKPDPRLFLHAAAKMGVPPEACLVVEDSSVGIEAAKAAGMSALHFSSDGFTIEGVESFSAYDDFVVKLSALSEKLLPS